MEDGSCVNLYHHHYTNIVREERERERERELLFCYALLTETQLLLKRNNANIAPSHFGFISYADDLLIALH